MWVMVIWFALSPKFSSSYMAGNIPAIDTQKVEFAKRSTCLKALEETKAKTSVYIDGVCIYTDRTPPHFEAFTTERSTTR